MSDEVRKKERISLKPGRGFHSKRKELHPKRKGVRSKEKRRFAQRKKESNLQNEILQQRGVGAEGIGYL